MPSANFGPFRWGSQKISIPALLPGGKLNGVRSSSSVVPQLVPGTDQSSCRSNERLVPEPLLEGEELRLQLASLLERGEQVSAISGGLHRAVALSRTPLAHLAHLRRHRGSGRWPSSLRAPGGIARGVAPRYFFRSSTPRTRRRRASPRLGGRMDSGKVASIFCEASCGRERRFGVAESFGRECRSVDRSSCLDAFRCQRSRARLSGGLRTTAVKNERKGAKAQRRKVKHGSPLRLRVFAPLRWVFFFDNSRARD